MLNNLSDLLEKKGEKWISNFLNNEVIITEKLDTYRILFEKQGDELIFFKKDNTPLNLIERVLNNVWEDAIIEISTLVDNINIPEGLRFGIAYTPVERPIRIPYSNLPKYILTDITKRDNSNKVIESYDYNEITQWASIFSMGRPPIIFKGILTEEQKNLLLKYDKKEYEGDTRNFSQVIKQLFNNTYSEEEIIEGIVIKSNKNLAQVTSYEFDVLNEAYQKKDNLRDFYDLVILSINSFMDSYTMPILEGETEDELYLEIISDMFNNYCKKGNIPEGLDPNYITPPSFGHLGDLNILLIKNKETLEYLKNGDKLHEALFRLMLSSFRKQKKEYGLITESAANKFNTYIYLIESTIKSKLKDNNIIENEEILVKEDETDIIDEARSDNVVIDTLNKRKASDIDNMRVISSIQKAFEPRIRELEKGKEEVAVYVTDCTPFTKSQMENLESIHKTWKVPVIISTISNKKKVEGKNFFLSDELLKAQLETLYNFNSEFVPAYILLDNWSLWDIFYYCRPNYEPIVLITDDNKKAEFANQLYFEEEIMGGRLNVKNNFNIGEMENKYKLEAFRAIEDNAFYNFKETTPSPIHNLWDNINTEYRTWSGQLLNIF